MWANGGKLSALSKAVVLKTNIWSVPLAAAMDFSALMPALSVTSLTPLYGYFIKIIIMQLD